MKTLLEIKSVVSQIAKDYDVKSVKLFGSYADGRATAASDIDLLVEYNAPPTLLNFLGLKEHLQDKLKIKVDLVKYPINPKHQLYDNFKINKVIPLYG